MPRYIFVPEVYKELSTAEVLSFYEPFNASSLEEAIMIVKNSVGKLFEEVPKLAEYIGQEFLFLPEKKEIEGLSNYEILQFVKPSTRVEAVKKRLKYNGRVFQLVCTLP